MKAAAVVSGAVKDGVPNLHFLDPARPGALKGFCHA
jgi:hypothetical protein